MSTPLEDFAPSIGELTEAVRAANSDPADAIRQLASLASYGRAQAPAPLVEGMEDPPGIAGFSWPGPSGQWCNTTRATWATYEDAQGAVRDMPPGVVRPWFRNGVCVGWHDEPARTNLISGSDDIALGSGLYSIGSNTIDLGKVAAPDGRATARRVQSNHATGTNHFVGRSGNLAVSPNTAYSASVYLRQHAGAGTAGRAMTIDEFNGATYTRSSGVLLTTWDLSGGRWRRYERTITTKPDTTALRIYWLDFPFQGDAHDVWGCQIEQGEHATTLIRTAAVAGSTATRAADLIAYVRDAPLGYVAEAQEAAREATAALCRRAALSSLARAVAEWTPATGADAADALKRLLPLYDAEITAAGDAGEDEAFAALRALRAAVADDLHARGVRLPEVVRVRRNVSRPGLVLAHSLFGNATREDELTRRADPINPLFFPAEFDALSG